MLEATTMQRQLAPIRLFFPSILRKKKIAKNGNRNLPFYYFVVKQWLTSRWKYQFSQDIRIQAS